MFLPEPRWQFSAEPGVGSGVMRPFPLGHSVQVEVLRTSTPFLSQSLEHSRIQSLTRFERKSEARSVVHLRPSAGRPFVQPTHKRLFSSRIMVMQRSPRQPRRSAKGHQDPRVTFRSMTLRPAHEAIRRRALRDPVEILNPQRSTRSFHIKNRTAR